MSLDPAAIEVVPMPPGREVQPHTPEAEATDQDPSAADRTLRYYDIIGPMNVSVLAHSRADALARIEQANGAEFAAIRFHGLPESNRHYYSLQMEEEPNPADLAEHTEICDECQDALDADDPRKL